MSIPERKVDSRAAMNILAMIYHGELTEEEGFRLLFPEEAVVVYDIAKWPWGAPTRLGAPKGGAA